MEVNRWKLVDDLLQAALDLAPESRDEFLERACEGDPDLAHEIRSLLTSHRQAGDFLESPAVEFAARSMAAEAEHLLSDSMVGQVVSHYRLLKMIGRGGMGSVWLAERCDGRFERKVAFKFIHLAVLDQVSADRFKREGAILGKLTHPQIAELIDAGLTSLGEPFLVLEYVEGQAIDTHCDKNKLSVEARLTLFLDVLSAVAHAHSNLIVHRDIKPSNVFVSSAGQVKLLDFGIAKVLADESNFGTSELTLDACAMMTPRFAAPEQVSDGAITTGTDIYTLGVLLYLLLTGQHPAGPGTQSPAQLIKTIVDQEPVRPSEAISPHAALIATDRATTPDKLHRRLRGDLDRIVLKAIKKNPADRYPSVSAFADDLQRYLDYRPILARPDSRRYRAAKFVRRHSVGVGMTGIALMALTAGITDIEVQERSARAQRDFALRQLVRVQRHDEFLDFLLSDAAPSGKPFTVNNLLDRARHILEKQKTSPTQIDLLEWIGEDYASQDQPGVARPVLERAYQLSRQSTDPSVRAAASCTLAAALARDEDLNRAEALIKEGLGELPNDSQFALSRVACLRQGGQVAQQSGHSSEAVRRVELAREVLRASPFDTDESEMSTTLDLASAYSDAAQDRQALSEFQRASELMSSLGRDETGTGIVLYNNWALELEQIGRPLEAEKVYRRVIDISRDNESEEAVSPMVMLNFARVQRRLDHLVQAADYAERAYEKAVKTGDELVVNQSLLERSLIYLAQHNAPHAEAMLGLAEPRLRKMLPPGHYAFAAIASDRGLIAIENHDLPLALRLTDEAIRMIQAAVKAGGDGGFILPTLYIQRSAIELSAGRAEEAESDARRALYALQPNQHPDDISSRLGLAYLAQARALAAEGKAAPARATAILALRQLQVSMGPDHPDTQSAQLMAR